MSVSVIWNIALETDNFDRRTQSFIKIGKPQLVILLIITEITW